MAQKAKRLKKEISKVCEKLVDFLAVRHAIEDYRDAVSVDKAILCQMVNSELRGLVSNGYSKSENLDENIISQFKKQG